MTNREFANTDANFQEKCSEADIPATKRQASKFRNKKGKAFKGEEGK